MLYGIRLENTTIKMIYEETYFVKQFVICHWKDEAANKRKIYYMKSIIAKVQKMLRAINLK